MKKLIFAVSLILFSAIGFNAQAAVVGETQNFYIQSDYDLDGRSEISASLIKYSPNLYFYIDQEFWHDLDYGKQSEIRRILDDLAKEFEDKIYPTLTDAFGSEWKPGIDKDERTTILFHPMKNGFGGYFNSGDEYLTIQVPNSNQREMIYLNSQYIDSNNEKAFLAHEFTHLITFNQKERENNVFEDIWLNEARAEYSSALLGYSDLSIGNIFRKRVEDFIESPNDALCEWENKEADYGVINLFIYYLVDHYGIEILADSLHSEKVGIESINYALEKNEFEKSFSEVFTDWTIAILVNDCDFSEEYCYQYEYSKNLQIAPSLNFLAADGKSSLTISSNLKSWEGNWYKFVGGKGDLELKFIGSKQNTYRIPYLIGDSSGNLSLDFFELDSENKGNILISSFGTDIISVTVIPLLQTKTSDFDETETAVPFLLQASTIKKPVISISFDKQISEMTEEELIDRISELEGILNQLKSQLHKTTVQKFNQNLYYGIMHNEQVIQLQEFLKNEGVYPEELITGNFLSLTQKAVIKFQEKYRDEILTPLGISEGTGFVGSSTISKINQLLGY